MKFIGSKRKKLTFNQLLPDEATKEEKIYTFVPLLYLTNQRKIDIKQDEHFGDIDIHLASAKSVKVEKQEVKA